MVRYSRLAVGAAAALAFCSALPGKWTVERVMSTAGSALLIHLLAAKSLLASTRLDLLFRHLFIIGVVVIVVDNDSPLKWHPPLCS